MLCELIYFPLRSRRHRGPAAHLTKGVYSFGKPPVFFSNGVPYVMRGRGDNHLFVILYADVWMMPQSLGEFADFIYKRERLFEIRKDKSLLQRIINFFPTMHQATIPEPHP